MSLKDLIAAAFNKDATAFESAFSSVMQDKVASAIDSRFLAREGYDLDEAKKDDEEDEDEEDESEEDDEDEMCEDVDQIDELDRKTLYNYLTKSGSDLKAINTARKITANDKSPEDINHYNDLTRKAKNRKKGFSRAYDRLAKEEVEQIDELSKKTLGSYISKASDNAAAHGMKYGEKKAQSDEMDRMMNRHMSYSDKDKVRTIMKTTNDDVEAPRYKAAKRLKGIDTAVKKLTK